MDEAIYMLNALWLKRDGGAEKYKRYGAAAKHLLKAAGAEIRENYYVEKELIGEWKPDVFFMVKYPSQAAFETMINDPAYLAILPLREVALEKSLLIRCKEFSWA